MGASLAISVGRRRRRPYSHIASGKRPSIGELDNPLVGWTGDIGAVSRDNVAIRQSFRRRGRLQTAAPAVSS